ncbi:serine hydrolase [Streptococcus anginosus]|uniref:serine hydrolase domain-containing protein n=1 Tax=Streptococcus TaxID=1301 RepID=UPI00066CEEF8|nr:MULTISPECIES: serine hydrolase domain-containing protein [Streptococcus]MCW1060580.1 beta-lactamase family protein [Streptococcus anginosus]MDB8665135.1 serine hydrolase [Streptococcus anginosus]MDU3555809.1 serine hydrolase domain-containing protein [Streptococcus anginosus]MDX5004966.1 serine hydrolase domain-containing protein [Streptococcus anginosus]MDX5026477.1 serine hydrolase domain-containing protein [Streptococcus anginosus]
MSSSKILSKVEEQIAQQIYPGASLALYTRGEWQEYYLGESNPERSEKSRAGLVYDLASVSKVVGVGTILAFLFHEKKLDLDAPLTQYYPAFHDNSVTVGQLATHTSGLDPFIPNRDALNAAELKEALNHLKVLDSKRFRYTDVNFLLLGFMVEEIFHSALSDIFEQKIFQPWGMKETAFGPVAQAVPTVRGVKAGIVHDPKARVLGRHAGSAGLFSTVRDLKLFLEHYLQDDFAATLTKNFSKEIGKTRSLAWDLDKEWLQHTGYTGTFIMFNRLQQKVVIFLSNRTYEKDERAQWILDRNELMDLIKQNL